MYTFKSGYDREGTAEVSDNICDACGNDTLCFCVDSSEGEYGDGCFCLPCIQKAFSIFKENTEA